MSSFCPDALARRALVCSDGTARRAAVISAVWRMRRRAAILEALDGMATMTAGALRVLSDFLGDLHRLQEPAGVLRTVDRWARRLAPYDFAVPALTHRTTGAVALAGVPHDFAEGYERHATEDASRLAHLRPGHAGAVRLSEVVPSRDLHRSGIWNELMRPHRIRHVMTTCLVENLRLTGVLKMIRVDGRDFSEDERDVLALAAPHVRLAYANAEAMTEVAQEARRLHLVCDRIEGGILLLDVYGGVLFQNTRAEALCRRYFGSPSRRGPRAGAPLPDALRGLVVKGQACGTFAGPEDRVLTVRRAHLEDGDVLLLLDEHAPPGRHGLSPREGEVLHWVAEGKTNQEIGLILGISARTVQTHLEHVFAKLGVVSRAQAVAEALRRP